MPPRPPSVPDPEWPNVVTHGLGLVAAAVGGVFLVVLAALTGDPFHIVEVSVFFAAVVLLYSASTAYHAVREPRLKARLKVLDHASIHLLIAGTYTPFVLGSRGVQGWSLTLLVAGGVAYTAGTPFYLMGRLRWNHAVWHLFVLAGTLLHALAVGTALT